MNVPDTQIAVTLFNLREYCKNESELDSTLDRLCEFGYKAVQVSAVPLPPEVIRKQLDKHNLYCCAAHEGIDMVKDPIAMIDKMQALGCDFVALGAPPPELRVPELAVCKELADIFNASGAKMLEKGIRLGYHNHHFEFQKVKENGKTFLENFYDLTDKDCVFAELDVHWVTRGGGSPIAWINKVAGRMPVCHFKDFVMINENDPVYCEVGEGNLDWDSIIKACNDTGVRFFSIEQDMPFPGRDIFTSVKMSIDNLHKMGVK